jgi:hypothetical protein
MGWCEAVLACCPAGLGVGLLVDRGQLALKQSSVQYKNDKCTCIKYPWVIGFGLLFPKPIPVYPMGGHFVPYTYRWGHFLSHTRTLIGEFPMG